MKTNNFKTQISRIFQYAFLLALCASFATLSSCSKDEEVINPEKEVLPSSTNPGDYDRVVYLSRTVKGISDPTV